MSSFIPSEKHFNSAEYAVKMLTLGSQFQFPASFRQLFPELYYNMPTSTGQSYSAEAKEKKTCEIFDTLRLLTVLCVCLQYKDHYKGQLDDHIQTNTMALIHYKTLREPLNNYGLLKALQCIDYQIETNHLKELRALTLEEENAMFFLKEMIICLALDLIHKSSEYDKEKYAL